MEPMDILSLSRTSRYIYYMLMDTGSSAIWKKARSLIADVPECPSDLTEAEYARLLFGNDCYVSPLLKRVFFFNTRIFSVASKDLQSYIPHGSVDFEPAHHA